MEEVIIGLLIAILFALGAILGMLILIYNTIWKEDHANWLHSPVNQYGENFADAIQNGIVRGQRGIATYE